MSNEETAKIFKAFCDENRVGILKLLVNGEKCACQLLEEFEISQPTLSHHMKILCEAGIITARKEGKWIHYKIDEKGSLVIGKLLQSLTTEASRERENCIERKNNCTC